MEQTVPNDPYGLRAIVDEWRSDVDGRKLSYEIVAAKAREYGAPDTFVGSWLSKLFTGDRPYDENLLAAIARALKHDPDDLPHYNLALARRLLDERTLELEGALENLDYFKEGLEQRRYEVLYGARRAGKSRSVNAVLSDMAGNRVAIVELQTLEGTSLTPTELAKQLASYLASGELVVQPVDEATPSRTETLQEAASAAQELARRRREHPEGRSDKDPDREDPPGRSRGGG